MIDVKLIREDPEGVKKGIAAKQADPALVDRFLELDQEWRTLTRSIEEKRAQQKKFGEERRVDEAKALKEEIKEAEAKMVGIEIARTAALKHIPNPPLLEVPLGKDGSENVTLREVGKKPIFAFPTKNYIELAEPLGIIDTERAAKVSGSRFGYILGAAARIEFALIQLVVDAVTDEKLLARLIRENKLNVKPTAFIPVIPPVLIKREMMEGMGYVERGADEIYLLDKDDMYLVGTSEQSVGPMHYGETFHETELPRRYLGFSSCFRREAGSYGKDTKGILRVHQFDKLEMFSFTTSERSIEEHKFLLAIEEHLMQELDVPYRVLDICTGDLGDPAAAKYDIEAWMPGQNGGMGEYRETHSTSNTTDYQARRLQTKVRRESGETEYVHMLNGTAFAIGRILITIIENNQGRDGSIKIPAALKRYMGGIVKIRA